MCQGQHSDAHGFGITFTSIVELFCENFRLWTLIICEDACGEIREDSFMEMPRRK